MIPDISPNTKAILLLTAPLLVRRGTASSDLLSPGEYKRFARHLREIQRQPADLVSQNAIDTLRACQTAINEDRLQKLLNRGFLLSQAIEHWRARAIWVISRADPEYPCRLKARLREDAPAVIYGCGDLSLLDSGGLAVVGSRHVNDTLINFSMSIGQLSASARKMIVSGGAKGIDQAAMRGALEMGGKACGVLADNLEKTIMNREHRNLLLDGQLVLISPYDPSAGFNVGNAMQRNKLIYALADASLVVNSDLNKGGTWSGAKEQLEKYHFAPVFVRSSGVESDGLNALRKKGALPWPNPQDKESFVDVFSTKNLYSVKSSEAGNSRIGTTSTIFNQVTTKTEPIQTIVKSEEPERLKINQADILFCTVREVIQRIMKEPMKDTEVAKALNVGNAQARAWLQRLEKDGVVERQTRPVRYVLRDPDLFPQN